MRSSAGIEAAALLQFVFAYQVEVKTVSKAIKANGYFLKLFNPDLLVVPVVSNFFLNM
jgi:hypothetical protein